MWLYVFLFLRCKHQSGTIDLIINNKKDVTPTWVGVFDDLITRVECTTAGSDFDGAKCSMLL